LVICYRLFGVRRIAEWKESSERELGAEVKGQRSEVRRQKPEDRGLRGLRAKIGDQKKTEANVQLRKLSRAGAQRSMKKRAERSGEANGDK
jgi:hypothetical protein